MERPGIEVMVHEDDCGEILDSAGRCPKCGFHPSMQDTSFKTVQTEDLRGRTALGLNREPLVG